MLANLFQLTGSFLLAYYGVFRTKKDIISLSKYNSENKGIDHNSILKLSYETWLSRFGLLYVFIGYLITFLDKDQIMFLRNLFGVKVIIKEHILLIFVIMVTVAYCASKIMQSRNFCSIVDEELLYNARKHKINTKYNKNNTKRM